MPKSKKFNPLKVIPVVSQVNELAQMIKGSMKIPSSKKIPKPKKRVARNTVIYQSGHVRVNTRPTQMSTGQTVIAGVRAPLSSSALVSQNSFQVGSGKVAKADVDDHNGMRVSGSGCLTIKVAVNTTDASILVVAASTAFTKPLILSVLDERLATIAAIYTKYIIRGLEITYIPLCPTTTTSGMCLGIIEDLETASAWGATPTCARLMEQRAAQMAPYWNPLVLRYASDGVKSYHTSASSATDDSTQLWLGGVDTSEAKAVGAASLGRLECRYTVDFYLPRQFAAVQSNLSDTKCVATSLEKDVKTEKSSKEEASRPSGSSASSAATVVSGSERKGDVSPTPSLRADALVKDNFYVVEPGASGRVSSAPIAIPVPQRKRG